MSWLPWFHRRLNSFGVSDTTSSGLGVSLPCFVFLVVKHIKGTHTEEGLQGDMAEEIRDRLAIVGPPNSLCEDH